MIECRIFEHPDIGRLRCYIDPAGEPWFCALDVAEGMLRTAGLNLGPAYTCNPSKAFSWVPNDMKAMKPIITDDGPIDMLTLNVQGLNFIFDPTKEPVMTGIRLVKLDPEKETS
jgi:hypothetical protein